MWWVASFIDAHTAHAARAELRRCLRCVTIGASRWRYWLKLPWRLPGQAGFIFFLRRCLSAVLLRCSARRRWSDTEGCLQIRQLARAATRHHPTSRQRCCSARPADEPPPAAAALGLTARAISAGGCAHMAARARRLRSRGEARGSVRSAENRWTGSFSDCRRWSITAAAASSPREERSLARRCSEVGLVWRNWSEPPRHTAASRREPLRVTDSRATTCQHP